MATDRPSLTILLAGPRGFCAGVDRAIQIVETALRRYGAPVYVRHEIVHNRHVVRDLEAKGAVFVDELDDVPNDVPVVFSAHGVPKAVPAEARRRRLFHIDATCPLVSKVHREAERQFAADRHLLLIGHAGHPEVEGTIGQLPDGAVSLIESVADAEAVDVPSGRELAFITQTTLSVDDTTSIIAALRARFPGIHGPKREDICYATTNRQSAVKAIARDADAILVVGAPNSSNSNRLVEVARKAGCPRAILIESAEDMDIASLEGVHVLGITAGALDAYTGPYKNKYRYWTGFLLLVRVALFLVFAANVLGDPGINLLIIVICTAGLFVHLSISGGVYKTRHLNILEYFFLFNLITLSSATLYVRLAGGSQKALIFTSVSASFTVFACIVLFHTAVVIKSTQFWNVVKERLNSRSVSHTVDNSRRERSTDGGGGAAKVEMKPLFLNFNELREPILEYCD